MILYLHLPPIVPFHLILSSCTFPSLPFLLCYHFGFILLSLSSLYILFSPFPFLSLFLFFASLFKLSPLTHSNFLTFVFLLSSLSLSSITLSHRPSSFTLSDIPLLPYSTFSARLLFFYQAPLTFLYLLLTYSLRESPFAACSFCFSFLLLAFCAILPLFAKHI